MKCIISLSVFSDNFKSPILDASEVMYLSCLFCVPPALRRLLFLQHREAGPLATLLTGCSLLQFLPYQVGYVVKSLLSCGRRILSPVSPSPKPLTSVLDIYLQH